jgi:hypothetical protein
VEGYHGGARRDHEVDGAIEAERVSWLGRAAYQWRRLDGAEDVRQDVA